jgi:hypothetical protein
MDGHDAGGALRGREPRRPLASSTPTSSCAPTATAPTCMCDVATQRRRRALPAHLHRRGVRLDRRGLVHRDRRAHPALAVLGGEGRVRPDRAGVPRPTACPWWSPARPTTSGRTSSPRSSSRCSSPTCSTASKVPLYGDGSTCATGCSCWTTAPASTSCCAGRQVGEIYNIGAGNEKTNREITDTILAALGKDESSVEYVEDRKGHDRRYSIATDKVAALGWAPSRTFEQAIDDTDQVVRRPPRLVGSRSASGSRTADHADPDHRRQRSAGHRAPAGPR